MSRLTALLLIAIAGLCLLAGPAAAQRDPFEPAIDEGGVEAPASGEEETQQQPGEEPGPEPLADTGLESKPWLALSYVLVVLGVGLVVVTKISRPSSK